MKNNIIKKQHGINLYNKNSMPMKLLLHKHGIQK